MSVNPDVIERTVRTLQARLPGLLAVYGFGSRVQGTEGPDSDLDMAVLVAGYADVTLLWQLAGELADKRRKLREVEEALAASAREDAEAEKAAA